MKVYYWKGRANFGDLLTSLLLQRFTRLSSEWAPPEEAELVMVGSILEHLPQNFSGIIAGAGKLHESTQLKFPNANILSVRGPLTGRGLRGQIVYGDPGLLADELVLAEDKEYDLGIVPHWSDHQLEYNPIFTRYNPKIIRVGDNPLDVIREIGRCKKIVSSSLHGIILADAFGIPRRIEIAPRMLSHPHQEGGIFKFQDYSASLGIRLETGITQQPDRNRILDKQYELFDVFEEIHNLFKRT